MYLHSILQAFVYGKVERFNMVLDELLEGLKREEINFLIFILVSILPDVEHPITSRSFCPSGFCMKVAFDFPSGAHVSFKALTTDCGFHFVIAKNGTI